MMRRCQIRFIEKAKTAARVRSKFPPVQPLQTNQRCVQL